MSEFLDAIYNHRKSFQENLFNSFGFEKNNDAIKKSHIEYTFGDSPDFRIPKTGKEIKEKLNGMMIDEQQEISNYTNQINTLRSCINVTPEGDAEKEYYYLLDGFEDKVGVLPGQPYSHEQLHCHCCCEDSRFSDEDSQEETDEHKTIKLMWQYNDALVKWIGCKREIAMLNTMLINLVDNKSYNLSVKVATTLGF